MAVATVETLRTVCANRFDKFARIFELSIDYDADEFSQLAYQVREVLQDAVHADLLRGPLRDAVQNALGFRMHFDKDGEPISRPGVFLSLFGYFDAHLGDHGYYYVEPGTIASVFPTVFKGIASEEKSEWWDCIRRQYAKACELIAQEIRVPTEASTEPTRAQDHSDAVLDATELRIEPTNEARDQVENEAAQAVEIDKELWAAKVKEFRGYLDTTHGKNTADIKRKVAKRFAEKWKEGSKESQTTIITSLLESVRSVSVEDKPKFIKRYKATLRAMIQYANKDMQVENHRQLFIDAVL